ncbi:MAG TPA: asparagine synthase (glutamine-hydrolyzing) [Candidatus Wallbacteria bacterium]|nr:asparagine synthase (glutamine-hydrolyzing) [Candidatus Wallbacteria bacterium]
MCGITGTLVFNNSDYALSERNIFQSLDTMAHRGPDNAGVWISGDKKIGLGQRRLSIIDLSAAANQPMSNGDESIWCVFNGEIYNHADIRKELEMSGRYKWKTDHSDTEVVIHSFEEWGIDCVERFRGMFAIAFWDCVKRELWLIRDRAGKKPLYFSAHNGRINFASEIKALLTDKAQKRQVNEEAFYHFLSFLTTPAPHTLFSGIKKVPCGHYLKVDADGNIRMRQYWDVLDNLISLENYGEDEIAELVLSELRTSVKLRKESDVPVGVFLSGGVDSSTNAVLFSEDEKSVVKTFTIGYDEDYKTYKNEFEFSQAIADKIKSDHHCLKLSQDDLINFLPLMIRHQDEPIADPVCFPIYAVSKLARENGVIVCQVGEGADELFGGYPSWNKRLLLSNLNDMAGFKIFNAVGMKAFNFFNGTNHLYYEFLRRGSLSQPIFWGGAEAFTENRKKSLISKRLKEKFKNYTSWEAIRPLWKRFLNKNKKMSNLLWMSYLDLNLRLPELLLMRVDKMSMIVSLEARAPFLDHKFVELAMSVSDKLKIRNNENKYILKKAVKNLIPDEIIHRTKQGFNVPVYEWFFDRLGNYARKELTDFCKRADFFDSDSLNFLFNENMGQHVWYLFNFVLWHKEFIEK